MQCNMTRYTFAIGLRPAENPPTTQGDTMDTGSAGGVIAAGLGILILIWALNGLVIGALARWALPGPDPMSWPATIGFGIAGSFLGGIVGRLLNLPTALGLLLSVGGAALLIWFFKRRKAAPPQ
jgi:uncharacterized membrane protein YeaQ/YmgE (transglycosylase-associated protein family)